MDTHEFTRENAGTDHAVAGMMSEEYHATGERLMLLRHLPARGGANGELSGAGGTVPDTLFCSNQADLTALSG